MRIDFVPRPLMIDGVPELERTNRLEWFLVDPVTGKDVTPRCLRWADDETGEYEVLARNEKGLYFTEEYTAPEPVAVETFDGQGNPTGTVMTNRLKRAATEIHKGNFRIEHCPRHLIEAI